MFLLFFIDLYRCMCTNLLGLELSMYTEFLLFLSNKLNLNTSSYIVYYININIQFLGILGNLTSIQLR